MENSLHTGATLATASREPSDMKMSCLISSGSIPHNEGLVVDDDDDGSCCWSCSSSRGGGGEASCMESKASVAAATEALQAWKTSDTMSGGRVLNACCREDKGGGMVVVVVEEGVSSFVASRSLKPGRRRSPRPFLE